MNTLAGYLRREINEKGGHFWLHSSVPSLQMEACWNTLPLLSPLAVISVYMSLLLFGFSWSLACSFEMASKLVFLPPVTSTSEPSSPPFHRLIHVNISHFHLKLFGASKLHTGSKPNSRARPMRCPSLLPSDLPNSQCPLCSSTAKLLVSPLLSLSLSLCTFASSGLPLPTWKEASSSLPRVCISPSSLGLLPPL